MSGAVDLVDVQKSIASMSQAKSMVQLLHAFRNGLKGCFDNLIIVRIVPEGLAVIEFTEQGARTSSVIALKQESQAYRVITQKKPVILHNAHADPCVQKFEANMDPQVSAVMVPIVLRERCYFLVAGLFRKEFSKTARQVTLRLVDFVSVQLYRLVKMASGRAPQPASGKAPHQATTQPNQKAEEIEQLGQELASMIISNKIKVPPYPAVAQRLSRTISSDNYTFKELAEIINEDQTLLAGLLRSANSAYYQATTKVTTAEQAISRIGIRTLVSIIMGLCLGKHAYQDGPLQEMRLATWRQSMTAAHVSQHLAQFRRIDRAEAFVCGLLHDFGKVLALACLEEILAKRKDHLKLPQETFVQLVDQHHVELGRQVAHKWNLPESVTEVLANHHRPEMAEEHRAMVNLVSDADRLSELLESEPHVSVDVMIERLGLKQIEADSLVDLLPELPHLTTAPDAVIGVSKESAVVKLETTFTSKILDVCFPVVHISPSAQRKFEARYICTTGMGLVGAQGLRENTLVQVKLELPPDPMQIWIRIALCVEFKEGFRVEGQTYALSRADLVRWNRMLADAEQKPAQ